MDAQQLRDALGAVRPAEPLGSFHCGDWVLGRLAVARHGADIVRDIAADKKRAEIHPRLRRHFALCNPVSEECTVPGLVHDRRQSWAVKHRLV